MNAPIEQRYLSLQQTSVYLGMSDKTLYKWAEAGTIPAKKIGRVWRFDKIILDDLMKSPASAEVV